MAIYTPIEWADSTLNIQMGCDGCELWNPKAGIKKCYAGNLTERYAGHSKGYPASFDQPQLFLKRLLEAGQQRKPANLDHFRSVRDDCAKAGVPFFCKQVDKVIPIPKDLQIFQMPAFTLEKQEAAHA